MITVVLLNWKRPKNLAKLIQVLASQTRRPVIYLWDNSAHQTMDVIGAAAYKQVDWYVGSSRNLQCPPRWWMAQQAETPYVMSFDDDLMPSDNKLLEDLLPQLDEKGPRRIVGAFGKLLNNSTTYELCPNSQPGEYCDIILGRVMIMATKSLRQRLQWSTVLGNNWGTVDDITLSGMFYSKYQQLHYCSEVFKDRLTELPDDFALAKEPGHFIKREAARRLWFDR